MTNSTPSPGSDEAIAAGCTCPILDNAHGRGYMGTPGIFVYTENCPLHGAASGLWDTLTEDQRDIVKAYDGPQNVGGVEQ